MTVTTERANPLRQWNPDWGGRPTARRPVAAVNKVFLRRSDFVKRPRRTTLGSVRGLPSDVRCAHAASVGLGSASTKGGNGQDVQSEARRCARFVGRTGAPRGCRCVIAALGGAGFHEATAPDSACPSRGGRGRPRGRAGRRGPGRSVGGDAVRRRGPRLGRRSVHGGGRAGLPDDRRRDREGERRRHHPDRRRHLRRGDGDRRRPQLRRRGLGRSVGDDDRRHRYR